MKSKICSWPLVADTGVLLWDRMVIQTVPKVVRNYRCGVTIRTHWQECWIEGQDLISSYKKKKREKEKKSKITINCEQPLTKKQCCRLSREIPYTQRQRRGHKRMAREVQSWWNQTLYSLDGWPTNWKIIIPRMFSQGLKVLSSRPGFAACGSGNRRRNLQEIWLWRLIRFNHRNSTEVNQSSTLGRCTQGLVCTRIQLRSGDFIRVWAILIC